MNAHFILKKILVIILFTTGFAGSSTIKGEITDTRSGEPLIGANIMLSGTMLGSATDENGFYLISDVPIGSFTIMAMFIGYETIEKDIQVAADQEYIVNLALKASAIKLQETKVTAEKRKEKITNAPASMEIITSRDIKGKNTTNMGAYLKGLKGIDFTSSGINNYSISVRGFNSSFNTRLLTLSDGRVANIPALRVINYSTIPQSMDDVDKIEIILGPATALYGANAHSGVVNIISKPPSISEGFTMSLSGSNDERQFRKINGRFAKKLSNSLSIKMSGLYLHAYDWPFISEEEYKSHLYPWTLTPGRTADGKNNNPWNTRNDHALLIYAINNEGKEVRIGNGEPDHGCTNIDYLNQESCTNAGHNWEDWDGDGVAGEDWFNGYDDDGDGLIDEDYFIADGIDNDGDGYIDEGIDKVQDLAYDGVDNDHNGIIDDEAGNGYVEASVKQWGRNIENNVLIQYGRRDSIINGEVNLYYIPNGTHLLGSHRYNEEKVILEFDIFTYDYGEDGIPGDGFEDIAGDTEFQLGECLSLAGTFSSSCDNGLDGVPGNGDPGENDGIWQPGDGWDDDGDGIVEPGEDSYKWYVIEIDSEVYSNCPCGVEGGNCLPYYDGCDYGEDIWPPLNGILDAHETHADYGQDGDPNTGDPGEDDGILILLDSEEMDGVFDTGDGLYGFEGELIIDDNGNGILDPGENYIDANGDGLYNAPDLLDDYQVVLDTNGDGMDDYPDFEIDNRKVEFRIDYDPNPDFNMTLQTGYSWTKTQQVTGTGRYLADGFEYKFYQIRSRYKNWFSQFYMNESFSGDTRGYNLGNRIIDKSKNYAFQIQNNFDLKSMNTKFVWGMDYFRTDPFTNGTIINDGPNGYDNDGDNVIIGYNGIDEDGKDGPDDLICPDGLGPGFRNGKLWKCGEGIDEPDEYIDPQSNEYGIYYQSTTELFGTSRFELITAARLDYHDLLEEGLLFAPKLGFIYKPDSKSSMRFTYGKAHNTPNSITLFTDLFVGKNRFSDIYLRGNYKGTEYCRVGSPCLGENYPTSVATPGFYGDDNSTFYTFGPSNKKYYFSGELNEGSSGYTCSNYNILDEESCKSEGNDWIIDESHWDSLPYSYRVDGAPYYFQFTGDDLLSGDNIPLDTAKNVIYVPELNGDGVLYTAEESINIIDVVPIKTEKIQTVEFGYKGFLGNRTHFSLDYYLSYYEDFFSPPTIITPLIVSRMFDENGNEITDIDDIDDLSDLDVQGIMTINDAATYPPYATAFNGIDDDGDWAEWAEDFGWDQDDKDGDCPNGAEANNLCWADPGEWGFIVYDYDDGSGIVIDTAFFHPWEVMQNKDGFPGYQVSGVGAYIYNRHGLEYITAGIDEWVEYGALREIETVEGANSITGEALDQIGITSAPYHLVLSPMNYGEVWMQGLDFGLTHFLTENIIIDGNLSWYGTTEFYNELTKKKDPINAPKWKWNASIKGTSAIGDFIINFRHVDKFVWSDGIWAGIIGPYNIIDLFYTYHITDNLDCNLSALNLNNDLHKELVGGAIMGRQIVMRFTSTF